MNHTAQAIAAFIQAGDLIGVPVEARWVNGGAMSDGGFEISMNLANDHPLVKAFCQANPVYGGVYPRYGFKSVKLVLKEAGRCHVAVSLEGLYDTELRPGYTDETRVQLDYGQWRPDPSGGFRVEVHSLKNIRFYDRSIKNANDKVITFCEIPFPEGLRWGTGIRVVLRPEDVETPGACAAVVRQLQTEVETRPAKLREYLLKPDVMGQVMRGREKEIAKRLAKELRGTI